MTVRAFPAYSHNASVIHAEIVYSATHVGTNEFVHVVQAS